MSLIVQYTLHNKKSGRVTYRRVYPVELRPVTGWEFKVALGLAGSAGLMTRWEVAGSQYEAAVVEARRQIAGQFDELDAPNIAYLAEAFRVELLDQDDLGRWDGEGRDLHASVAAQLGSLGVNVWKGHERQRWALKAREGLEMFLPHYRELRATGDTDAIVETWGDDAQELAKASGRLINPADSVGFNRLCRALNDAAIDAGEIRLRRQTGDIVPTPPEPVKLAREGDVHVPATDAKVPLLETYDGYSKARQLSPGVRIEWRRYIEHLVKFVGHDDAALLTADVVRQWRDHLLETPGRRGKLRSPVTIRDKYLMSLKTTLGWAVDEGKLPENVARAVVLKKPKSVRLRDPGFTDDEALSILRATLVPVEGRLSRHYALARRWIPWLCAYSGARVNEFSQMRREDLQQVSGVWCVRITPEAGTVKNREARVVPLHPHILAQGFVGVVQSQPPGPIFFSPPKANGAQDGNRRFKKVGEKLAEWVRKDVGIIEPALQPNHAWRHRFKSLSLLHGIEERLADAIQGHAPRTTGRKYGSPPVQAMAEAIAKLPRYGVKE